MHTQPRLPSTLGSTSTFTVRSYLVETLAYAVAVSIADQVGVTWNDGGNRPPGGYPKTFGHQQWFKIGRAHV